MGSEYYEYQLTLDKIMRNAAQIFYDSEIVYAPPGLPRVRLTYEETWSRIQRLGSALRELGVEEGKPGKMGTRVAVLDWNTHRYFELYHAVPSYGAVLHTVNILLSPEDLVYTMRIAEDEVVFTNKDFLPLVEAMVPVIGTIRKVVVMSDEGPVEADIGGVDVYDYEELVKSSRPYSFPELDERTVATMVFTSGTTGRPKGTYFTHRQLVLHSLAVALSLTAPPLSANIYDVVMPLVPLFHVHGWGIPYMAVTGQKQVYPGRFDWGHVLRVIEEEGVTIMNGVPTILHNLLYHPDSHRVNLRGVRFIVGGSSLTRGLYDEARRRGMVIGHGFGLTETGPVVSVSVEKPKMKGWSDEEKEEFLLKAGLPVPGVEVRVVDENMRDVPRDGKTIGEIVVRAPWLTREYFKEPEKTREAWRGGWFHTGDLATWDREGYITIMDRAKDVIKSGGEWIPTTRLEDLISTHPAVHEVAVIGVPHEKWVERPVAIIVPRQEYRGRVTEDDIKNHLMKYVQEGKIPKWWIPDRVVFVDTELPKTSTAKIDKKMLKERYGSQ